MTFALPIRFDAKAQLAQAHGFGMRRGWIGVGEGWYELTSRERHAVLLHEEAHLRGHHLLWRLLLLPLIWTPWAKALAVRQELEADAFAAEQGYGVDLLRVIRRYPSGHYYPTKHERITHLEAAIEG